MLRNHARHRGCGARQMEEEVMNEKIKRWIDNASYEDLLYRWRFASLGDPMFQGETGDYYAAVMKEKRLSVDHVQASKNIGWE